MPPKAGILKRESDLCGFLGGSWIPWGKVIKGQVCAQWGKTFSCSVSHGWNGLVSLICCVGYRFYRRKELVVVVKDVFDSGANQVSLLKSWVPNVHLSLQSCDGL